MIGVNTRTGIVCAAALVVAAAVSGAEDGAGPSGTIVPVGGRVADAEARAELAHSEAMLGHVDAARAQYRLLLQGTNVPWSLRLKYAGSALAWGDFRGSEQILRQYLVAFPGDRAISVRLAEVLAASQQFEAAEGKYEELLLETPDDSVLLLGLAGVKRAERDFSAALAILARVKEPDASKAPVLSARGDILFRLKRFNDAARAFSKLTDLADGRVDGLIGTGRCLLAGGDRAAASRMFADVLKADPGNVAATFYGRFCGADASGGGGTSFRNEKIGLWLRQWAALCLENNLRAEAVACLESAVIVDGDAFPARMALARALGADRQFDRSVGVYGDLRKRFPENYMLVIEQARVLSWARRYDESLDLYLAAAAMCPGNPVPAREMARVATWAKRMNEAGTCYAKLWDPTVDSVLRKELAEILAAGKPADDGRRIFASKIEDLAQSGPPYDGYEWFCENMGRVSKDAALERKLQKLRVRLMPACRIQKAAWLESVEKRLAWGRRHLRAAEACGLLVEFAPGNQEGLYDLSQLDFALGLDAEATAAMRRLLDLDPSHVLAPMVLARMDTVDNVYLRAEGWFWDESGRDEVSDIRRYRYGMTAGLPFAGRGYVEVTARQWEERPGGTGDVFRADGFSARGAGVLAPWLTADAGLTHKNYSDPGASDTDTGYAGASANIRDAMTVTVRRERTDELYNRFGVGQGTQADSWFLQCRSFLNHNVGVGASGRRIDYSDDNSGEQVRVDLSCDFTDHPRILKGTLFGEARDTDEQTSYTRDAGVLTGMVHPYWTPRNYSAWGAMLEWRHDVSPVFSRGTDLRFYDIVLTLRDDTEDNPAVELKGELHWETANSWLFGLEVFLTRSEKWDADGIGATVKRHF